MVVIRVPKTPKRAFNTKRPPSDLLKAQVAHLEAAARSLTPGTPLAHRQPKTEGQAAKYIEKLTRQMRSAAEPPAPPAPAASTPASRKAKAKAAPKRVKKSRPR